MSIRFYFINTHVTLTDRKKLKLFIATIFKKEQKTLNSLNVIFCTDEYLLEMNIKFLHHNFFTDVITFDLSEEAGGVSGEVYISADRVKENATLLGVSTNNELHRVIFHGILHLCGYKDKSKEEILQIRKAENKYLKSYFG